MSSNEAIPDKKRSYISKTPLAEQLVEEWHPTKNEGLDVAKITAKSNRKVWWLGKCGHEWQAMVCNRSLGRGCSICSGHTLLQGYNDLLTLKPLVASQFHPTKNAPLTVDQILVGSNRKIWWINEDCGHEWQMKVETRNEHVPCSICDGFIVLPGFNDLATTHPDLVNHLHPTKNGDLDITMLGAGSGVKVWWLGDCGHEWESRINGVSRRGVNCVYCCGRFVLKGFNDLLSQNPEAVSEWHPTKNLPLSPSDVTTGSGKKVWWKCVKGHEWETTVHSRAKTGGHGCPYCTGRNAVIGTNDLLSLNPILAGEWHPTLNGDLLPSNIKSGSNQKVWWKCKKGHEWQAKVNGRNRGLGCWECSAKIFISKSEQSIADFLISQGLDIKQTEKRIVKGIELDIYIPEKNFAIEYNGIYWHCDIKISDTKYHYNKWHLTKKAGIQLVQIWEDEWKRNPEQIKSMLLHKLGMSNQERVFARKTDVFDLTKSEIEIFLKENHIQEFASASYYLGLKDYNNELVAAISLKKDPNNALNIIRYATSKNVVGGFTKLLSYAEETYKPQSFVTFSDNCVSDGSLYSKNGFVLDKEIPPDYRYVIKGERKHKFGYRLNRFKEDPDLIWQDGWSESELAKLNGIPRIWDAGKIKWVKEVSMK